MNDGKLYISTDHGAVGGLVDPAGQPHGAAVVRHHPRVVRRQEADGVAAPQHVCKYFLVIQIFFIRPLYLSPGPWDCHRCSCRLQELELHIVIH